MGEGGSWERRRVMSDPPTTPEPEVGVSSWLALPDPDGEGSEGEATRERASLEEWSTWEKRRSEEEIRINR